MDSWNHNGGSQKKTCSYCAASIASNAKFCPHCGSLQPIDKEDSRKQSGGFSPTEELKVCPKCQEVIRIGDLVCPKCGKRQHDGIIRGIIITGIILTFLIFGLAIAIGVYYSPSADYEPEIEADNSALYGIVQADELPDVPSEFGFIQ